MTAVARIRAAIEAARLESRRRRLLRRGQALLLSAEAQRLVWIEGRKAERRTRSEAYRLLEAANRLARAGANARAQTEAQRL